ncbi:MAG: helix-turn-helix domain-containing protein [Chlorobia bacterium]|nr:helix-turn-helix domain-containing protein [Fimbriimonadaceae bacterium]
MEPRLSIDRQLLADNIRTWRTIQGRSQAELAARAGVGITTVYKAEQGKAVRIKYLQRIVELGLDALFEECCQTRRIANTKPPQALYVKHLKERTTWFIYGDHRRLVPAENLLLIQDIQERIRLGRLGLAHLFGCGLDYLMPDGPGMLLYEVHGPTDPITQNYRDAIYYVLRGSVLIHLGGETVLLDEGESIGYDGTLTVSMDLPEPLRVGQLPPLIQYIGANRVGKLPHPRKK